MWLHTTFHLYITFLLPSVVIGYIADLIFGDPPNLWHPVRFIGNMISVFEKVLRKPGVLRKHRGRRPAAESAAGLILVLLVLPGSVVIPSAVLLVCCRLHWALGLAVQSWMCYTILATKSLKTESMKVYRALEEDGLESGRHAVSMIVGRDTDRLDEAGVVKAAVETVAENTSDGVIAPLFYLVIGGPVTGYFYKAVNTMDSMVGYKNDRYRYFGTAAARLDDALNFLPARISALLMIGAAFLLSGCSDMASDVEPRYPGNSDFSSAGKEETDTEESYFADADLKSGEANGKTNLCGTKNGVFHWNGKNARRIWKRDRRNHASPNSAQTEAVMAGALGVQLAGDAWYFGEKHEKPTIGDDLRPVEAEDIRRANRLLYVTSVFGVIVFVLLRQFFCFWF
ncbi:MAG: adenosylcobinamide-phosphate synthase CbiB [Lachnospiraceae bacterium]|nr:adenosylcobinamide-phosphate synthase CbiB [Lachnospiraceae bacterium]